MFRRRSCLAVNESTCREKKRKALTANPHWGGVIAGRHVVSKAERSAFSRANDGPEDEIERLDLDKVIFVLFVARGDPKPRCVYVSSARAIQRPKAPKKNPFGGELTSARIERSVSSPSEAFGKLRGGGTGTWRALLSLNPSSGILCGNRVKSKVMWWVHGSGRDQGTPGLPGTFGFDVARSERY